MAEALHSNELSPELEPTARSIAAELRGLSAVLRTCYQRDAWGDYTIGDGYRVTIDTSVVCAKERGHAPGRWCRDWDADPPLHGSEMVALNWAVLEMKLPQHCMEEVMIPDPNPTA